MIICACYSWGDGVKHRPRRIIRFRLRKKGGREERKLIARKLMYNIL
jgi:hypothetical protein